MFSRTLLAALAAFTIGARASAQDSQVLFAQCPAGGSCGEDAYFDIQAELSWALSEGAEIIQSKDESFSGHTVRWSKYSAPKFQAVVQVTSEQDVQAVVRI